MKSFSPPLEKLRTQANHAFARSRFPKLATILDQIQAQASDDPHVLAYVYNMRASVGEYTRDLPQIKQFYPEAIKYALQAKDDDGVLEMYDRYVETLRMYGEDAEALKIVNQYLKLAQDLDLWEEVAIAAQSRAEIGLMLQDISLAIESYEQAFNAFNTIDHVDGIYTTGIAWINLLVAEDDLPKAEVVMDTMQQVFATFEEPELLSVLDSVRAFSFIKANLPERARPIYEHIVTHATSAEKSGEGHLGLLRVELASGNIEAAQEQLYQAQQFAGAELGLYPLAFIFHGQALIDLYTQPEHAEESLETALEQQLFASSPLLALDPIMEWASHAYNVGRPDLVDYAKERMEKLVQQAHALEGLHGDEF